MSQLLSILVALKSCSIDFWNIMPAAIDFDLRSMMVSIGILPTMTFMVV